MNARKLRDALFSQLPLLLINGLYTVSAFFWQTVRFGDVLAITICWMLALAWVGLRYHEIGYEEKRVEREGERVRTEQLIKDAKGNR